MVHIVCMAKWALVANAINAAGLLQCFVELFHDGLRRQIMHTEHLHAPKDDLHLGIREKRARQVAEYIKYISLCCCELEPRCTNREGQETHFFICPGKPIRVFGNITTTMANSWISGIEGLI